MHPDHIALDLEKEASRIELKININEAKVLSLTCLPLFLFALTCRSLKKLISLYISVVLFCRRRRRTWYRSMHYQREIYFRWFVQYLEKQLSQQQYQDDNVRRCYIRTDNWPPLLLENSKPWWKRVYIVSLWPKKRTSLAYRLEIRGVVGQKAVDSISVISRISRQSRLFSNNLIIVKENKKLKADNR